VSVMRRRRVATMSKSTALAKRAQHATALATKPVDIEAILLKAAESNMSLEGIERLMAMRIQLKAELAREAYLAALSAFQAECPPVEKTTHVYNKNKPHTPENIRYSYAPLEDIEAVIAPYCKRFGFSYTFKRRIDTTKKEVTTICVVNHAGGYSTPLEESGTFTAPIDPEAYMSETQKYGSAGSFSKRYALVDAFAVKLIGEDDDGAQGYDVEYDEEDRNTRANAARRFEEKQQERQRPRSTKQQSDGVTADTQTATSKSAQPAATTTQEFINDQQVGVLQAQMHRHGVTMAHLQSEFGFSKLQEIPLARINEVLKWIQK
jgi:hypothetical protein